MVSNGFVVPVLIFLAFFGSITLGMLKDAIRPTQENEETESRAENQYGFSRAENQYGFNRAENQYGFSRWNKFTYGTGYME